MNGGPAFPQNNDRVVSSISIANSQGMTLRDYFAAQAMQGFASLQEDGFYTVQSMAEAAYRWADAMLVERGE